MYDTMKIANTILDQLGGNRFIAMTGAKNFVSDGNTLRMTLPKNGSKANRLYITLDMATDTYTMRFFHYTAPRMNRKTFAFSSGKGHGGKFCVSEIRQKSRMALRSRADFGDIPLATSFPEVCRGMRAAGVNAVVRFWKP